MKQPTKEEISKNIDLVLKNYVSREEICEWAINYIRQEDQVDIDDMGAWHFLVAISNIDEMIAPDIYLFGKEDIQIIVKKYCQS